MYNPLSNRVITNFVKSFEVDGDLVNDRLYYDIDFVVKSLYRPYEYTCYTHEDRVYMLVDEESFIYEVLSKVCGWIADKEEVLKVDCGMYNPDVFYVQRHMWNIQELRIMIWLLIILSSE